jgi:hypothetical protein
MASTVFYYIWNVLSVGLLSAYKVSVKKAILEAEAEKDMARLIAQSRANAAAAAVPAGR